MKNSLKKTARWSALAVAMGIASIPAFQAQAAIYWPGGTGDKNKDTDFRLQRRSAGLPEYTSVLWRENPPHD
ncbi:hypothetical protein [Thiolapillus sp.]|uniref:hypothetical protein n=1 Tax=Thiolapillus sp. TaxID=2017437 RepID=UPI0025D996F1|nr:hypothetical protein [Thiolapillus sp.]